MIHTELPSKWWWTGVGGRTRTLALNTTGSVSLFYYAKSGPSTLFLFCLGQKVFLAKKPSSMFLLFCLEHNSPSGHNIAFDLNVAEKHNAVITSQIIQYLAWNSGHHYTKQLECLLKMQTPRPHSRPTE